MLVTDGPGETKDRRYGFPGIRDYEADQKFLFIDHLYDPKEEQGEGITSFYVRKFVYLDYFGRPQSTATIPPKGGSAIPHHSTTDVRSPSLLNPHPDPHAHLQLEIYRPQRGSEGMDVDTGGMQGGSQQHEDTDVMQQEQERQEHERQEQDRQEQERRERERLAQLAQEKVAQAQLEQEIQEGESQARGEQERQEQERLARQEQERQARVEQERQEQERLARQEQERLAQLEQGRLL